jgi:hypothetical protein
LLSNNSSRSGPTYHTLFLNSEFSSHRVKTCDKPTPTSSVPAFERWTERPHPRTRFAFVDWRDTCVAPPILDLDKTLLPTQRVSVVAWSFTEQCRHVRGRSIGDRFDSLASCGGKRGIDDLETIECGANV